MLQEQLAHQLEEDWIVAWNRRDLDAIMAHYAEDVEFRSPLIQSRLGIAEGRLNGKAQVRAYFAKGLETNLSLRFELLQVLMGVDSVTTYYRRENGLLAAEVVVLDTSGKAISVRVHYSAQP
jgi:ketosteroid isomerase-like protein